ncbi:hypothetical protein [Candidatus Methanoperedens nitratireducens]|uniref:hypothetical protein n=1 Tax=Candidatus Methanoperedens nitratireducens TaxID=1392998 RepID=UPI000BB992E6|nr:hypothetical protein [Candidatus Methanoperedens nitroreducens]
MNGNIQNGRMTKDHKVRTVCAINASIGITFATTVAVSLIPIWNSMALLMALLFFAPIAVVLYIFR